MYDYALYDETTEVAQQEETNKFFESLLSMLKGIIKTILPLIGLGYFVKYFD